MTTTTANKVLDRVCSANILRETTGNRRNRHDEYLNLFETTDSIEHDHTHG